MDVVSSAGTPISLLVGRGSALFRWTTRCSLSGNAEVQEALLLTLRESPLLMLLGLFWTQLGAVIAFICTHKSWALFWAIGDLAWLLLRIVLLRKYIECENAKQRPPHELVLATYVVWFVSIAAGSLACLLSPNIRTIVLGVMLCVGFSGYAASRFAATPRFAIAVLYLLAGALMIGQLHSAIPEVRMLGFVAPGVAVAYQIVMGINHRILVASLQAQQENRRLSRHDPLTGLPNRVQAREMLASLCKRVTEGRKPDHFAILCVDLDGFKAVNDRYGHAGGDWVLKNMADRMRAKVRTQDIVCRIGGDEFVILLPGADRAIACDIAQRLVEAGAMPHDLGGAANAYVGVSVGVSLSPAQGTDPELLISYADNALYEAKRSGKARYVVSGQATVSSISLVRSRA